MGHTWVRLIQRNSHQLPPPCDKGPIPRKGLNLSAQQRQELKLGSGHTENASGEKPTGLRSVWLNLGFPLTSLRTDAAPAAGSCFLHVFSHSHMRLHMRPPCFSTERWEGHADSSFKALVMYSKDMWTRPWCTSFWFSLIRTINSNSKPSETLASARPSPQRRYLRSQKWKIHYPGIKNGKLFNVILTYAILTDGVYII